jgi:hypothetical protein
MTNTQAILKNLEEEIKDEQLNSFDERCFDTVYKAVNVEEIEHVLNNCDHNLILIYARKKNEFFKLKRGA